MAITDWPAQERPREKLIQKGAEALTDAELLAIFLRTGTRDFSAVDLARLLLDDFGISDYMIEIGGEVRTAGFSANGSSWTIGIEAPTGSNLDRILHVKEIAVATSGDYRNVFISEGKRISHIIDPKEGIPVRHAGASVTVVGEQCARTDALATALAVLGPDKGYDLAVQQGWAAYFILRGDPDWTSRTTPAFAALLDQKSDTSLQSDWVSEDLMP